jgi:hypothetical protein
MIGISCAKECFHGEICREKGSSDDIWVWKRGKPTDIHGTNGTMDHDMDGLDP